MRKFYEVKKEFKKYESETKLPVRGTSGSAGYDFFSKVDVDVEPGQIAKIWSDVKVQMEKDEVLMLFVRSSMGGKFMLSNSTGIIDSDYFENEKNDGNCGLFLLNISDEVQHISVGDRIAQGIFMKYLVTCDDEVNTTRNGGFGSTNK